MTPTILPSDFNLYFQELWGREPFPWQAEFARLGCEGKWPKFVAVPTGSGKTACIDSAVFALAVQSALPPDKRTAARRIFFVVNRRVIVDEAYERAGLLCEKLATASPDSICGRVAFALRSIGDSLAFSNPLARSQLRGGKYLDRSWASSLLQPMVICSTVDQAGSRLLFRGYGVSDQARPVQAALLAQDSLIILDEAHISKPFVETLDWIAKYRARHSTLQLPFNLIQMTATPPSGTLESEQISLTRSDREHPILSKRLAAPKVARLVIEEKAKGKERGNHVAERLVKECRTLLEEFKPGSIVIFVNRVATARDVFEKLKRDFGENLTLFICRLRPIDREGITRRVQNRLKTGSEQSAPPTSEKPEIVVSTQCLEVGADLDFDALVTEAASLDALRQRFGRLNRAGRNITARAVVVVPADQNIPPEKLDESKPIDPIYGNSIVHTANWLFKIAKDSSVDFGIDALSSQLRSFEDSSPNALVKLSMPTAQAPILMPAYLDCWVQTCPAPALDAEVSLFLHGPQREMMEVEVCWRADLPDLTEGYAKSWIEALSLCPPTSAECLAVPINTFRDWLQSSGQFADLSSDLEETSGELVNERKDAAVEIPAVIWNGPSLSRAINSLEDIKPGSTIVLRTQTGGWSQLGLIPNAPHDPHLDSKTNLDTKSTIHVDVAEKAIALSRRRAVVRIHRALFPELGRDNPLNGLLEIAEEPDKEWKLSDVLALLKRVSEENSASPSLFHLASLSKPSQLIVERYPDGHGIVVTSRVLMPSPEAMAFEGDETDTDGLLESSLPVSLASHTEDVLEQVYLLLAKLPLDPWKDSLIWAAKMHDYGKADFRFQAMLRSATPMAAQAAGVLLAKSSKIPASANERQEVARRATLPPKFRHEMLSVALASSGSALPQDKSICDLILHLIATHHGYARPFAPVVQDACPPDVRLSIHDLNLFISSADRLENPAHALDSGLTERFWQMNRAHGWWGLAFLEAVLRMADQRASAHPQTK